MTQALRMLLAENVISFDQLDRATAQSAARGGTVDFHLVRMGAIDEDQLVRFLVRRFPVQHWTRNRLQTVSDLAIAEVPVGLALEVHAVPVALAGTGLTIALTDPSRRHAIEEISRHTGRAITPAVVTHSDLEWALHAFYHGQIATPLSSAPPRPPSLPPEDAGRAIPLMHVKTRPDGRYGAALALERDSGRARVEVLHLPTDTRPPPGFVQAAPIPRATRDMGPATPPPSPPAPEPVLPLSRPAPEPALPLSRPAPEPALPLSRPAPDSWASPPRAIPSRPPAPEAPPAPLSSGPPLPPPRPEAVLLAAMGEATTRDEVIVLALEHMRHFAERALFLAVKKQEIRGMDATGRGTSREAIRSFWVPVSARSTLSQVINDRQLHLGALSRHPADGVLSAALGGRPDRVLVIPVVIRNRVVALLFADRLTPDLPPGPRLVRLAEAVADNFARLLKSGGG